MTACVLDASLALAIVLPDEVSPIPEERFRALASGGIHVPARWWLEVGNSLVVAERRGRLSPPRRLKVMDTLRALQPVTEAQGAEAGWGRPTDLALRQGLTLYDACYLALALRLRAILLSEDRALRRAAAAEGIQLLP